MRVLLVEDDHSTSSALRRLLAHQGHDVTVAMTLGEAMGCLDGGGGCPEAVILDLMLPDGNGVELLRRVRERELAVRVVVTTGMMDAQALNDVKRLQPYALMIKPIDIRELLKSLG